jgi:MFS family permease
VTERLEAEPAIAVEAPAPVAEEEVPRRLGPLAAFESVPFRYLWASSFGFGLVGFTQRFAFVWLILDVGGGAGGAGLVTFVMGLPTIFLSLPAGVLADRMDRRRLMIGSQIGVIVFSALVAVLLAAHMLTVPLVMVLALCLGAAQAIGMPVRQAAVPSVVPPERLMNAIVLNGFVMNISMIVGPALGGAVIKLWGLVGAFTFAAAVYLVSLGFLIPLRLPPVAPRVGGDRRGAIREGLAFIWSHAGIRTLFVLLAISGLVMMGPFGALLPTIAREQLGKDALQASLLFTALGIGTVVATVVLASIGGLKHRGAWFIWTMVPGGIGWAAIGLSRSYALTAAIMLVWGIGGGLFMNLNQTLVQSNTPSEFMGRVMSVHTLCFMGISPIGALLAGAGAGVIGAGNWVVISGLVWAGCAVMFGITQPALRRMP